MARAGRAWLPVIISLLVGIAATIGIALACAAWSPPPYSWSEKWVDSGGLSDPDYRALVATTSPGEQVISMECRGVGYVSKDIRYYDAQALQGSTRPQIKRRSFNTELGWPNGAIATSARAIGLRFTVQQGQSQNIGDHAIDDVKPARWSIRWSGFAFDTLLYATLTLGIWAFFAVRSAWRRTMTTALCIGLWIALLGGWGCDMTLQLLKARPGWWPLSYHGYHDPPSKSSKSLDDFRREVRAIDTPNAGAWDQFGAGHMQSIGYDMWFYGFSKRAMPSGGRGGIVPIEYVSQLSLGWPFCSLRGKQIPEWAISGLPASETRSQHLIGLFALPVHWPGLIGNWIVYSGLIVVLWKGPGRARAWWRVRNNRCGHCGYPVGASELCSECGKPVRRAVICPTANESVD